MNLKYLGDKRGGCAKREMNIFREWLIYTVYQENQYFVKNMLLLKNPQFLPNHYEILNESEMET